MHATGCRTAGWVGQAATADPVHTHHTTVQSVKPLRPSADRPTKSKSHEKKLPDASGLEMLCFFRMHAPSCRTVGWVGQAAIADPVHTHRSPIQAVRLPQALGRPPGHWIRSMRGSRLALRGWKCSGFRGQAAPRRLLPPCLPALVGQGLAVSIAARAVDRAAGVSQSA